jgi:hypothetical protein
MSVIRDYQWLGLESRASICFGIELDETVWDSRNLGTPPRLWLDGHAKLQMCLRVA